MLPWIEKYRPKKLENVIGNSEIIKHFKHIAKTGTLQHLLLTGRPGIGKTTSVICLARELLGEHIKMGFLELNASDQRGIDTVRNDILTFCKKKITLPPDRQKIIFLDEVEAMTAVAQQALLRTIEKYTHNTRFILACNSSASLIDALQSRCILRRFLKIKDEEMYLLLQNICEKENVKYDTSGLKAIIITANGDVRSAVNCLQTVSCTFDFIDAKAVSIVIDKPNYQVIENLVSIIRSEDEDAFNKALGITKDLLISGYTAMDIVKLFFIVVKDSKSLDEYIKLQYLNDIARVEVDLVSGSNDEIQLTALVARLSLIKYEVVSE